MADTEHVAQQGIEDLDPLTPERRRQQTRRYLLRAAGHVFAERGFQGASLDEVAKAAGFTKGAVYSNFKSKEDLILELLEEMYEQELRDVRSILEASDDRSHDRMPEFVDTIWRQMQSSPDWWLALYQEFRLYAIRNPAVREKLAEVERGWVRDIAAILEAEGDAQAMAGIASAETLAWILQALFQGISLRRAIDPEVVDEHFVEATLAFVSRALEPG